MRANANRAVNQYMHPLKHYRHPHWKSYDKALHTAQIDTRNPYYRHFHKHNIDNEKTSRRNVTFERAYRFLEGWRHRFYDGFWNEQVVSQQ